MAKDYKLEILRKKSVKNTATSKWGRNVWLKKKWWC